MLIIALVLHVASIIYIYMYIYIYILYIYVVLVFAIDIHVALLYMYLLFGGIYCLRVVWYMYFCILFSTVLEDCI